MIKKLANKLIARISTCDWRNLALILLCGSVLSLAYLRYQFGWLSFVSLVPMLWFISNLQSRNTPPRKLVRSIWMVGVVFMGITISWMYQLRTVDLIADPWTRGIFVPLTLGLMVAIFSLGFWLLGRLYVKLDLSLAKPSSLVLFPAIWVLSEFFRSVAFSIIMLGEGGSIGMHWNFGVLGLGASATPLIYGARIVGLFGLSLMVVIINMAIYQLIFGKLKKQAIAILALVVIVPVVGYMLYASPTNKAPHTIGITHLSPWEDISYEQPLLESIARSNNRKVDVVVFPEYSNFLEGDRFQELHQNIADKILENANSRVITTRTIGTDKTETNAIVELAPDGKLLSAQGKTFLVPGGEYVPYIYKAILIASGNSALISVHEDSKTVYQSPTPLKPIRIGQISYGVLACSGVIAPEFYRDLTKRGANVLVNSASLSTMGMGKEYHEQAKQMVRFQAVANARPFVQSARGGESFIMDLNGNITTSMSDATGYATGEFNSNDAITPYTLLGEWTVLVSALGLMGWAGYLVYYIRKTKKKAKV